MNMSGAGQKQSYRTNNVTQFSSQKTNLFSSSQRDCQSQSQTAARPSDLFEKFQSRKSTKCYQTKLSGLILQNSLRVRHLTHQP